MVPRFRCTATDERKRPQVTIEFQPRLTNRRPDFLAPDPERDYMQSKCQAGYHEKLARGKILPHCSIELAPGDTFRDKHHKINATESDVVRDIVRMT
jgi:hypothetical protein